MRCHYRRGIKFIKCALFLFLALQIYWLGTRMLFSHPSTQDDLVNVDNIYGEPENIGLQVADHEFIPLNTDNVDSVNWVCISNTRKEFGYKRQNEHRWKWYLNNKDFILPARECNVIPQKRITIHGNKFKHEEATFHEFNVTYTQQSLPEGFMIIEDRVAYFNGFNKSFPFRPYNFYHFILQDFFSLHYVIKHSNRLGANSNDVFFKSPAGFCPGKFVPFDMTMSKPFFRMLGIENASTSIHQDNPHPDRVCYKNAIFNSGLHTEHALEAIRLIKQKLAVADQCKYQNLVTIAQRGSYRKILNIERLKKVAMDMGYNVTIVIMETLSLAEQAQLIHCTNVLVGIQGAALTWANFMKDYSGLIEIAWPNKGWHFFFTITTGFHSQLVGLRPLNMTRISVENCRIEPSYISMYYESMFLVKRNFSIEEATAIINDERNYSYELAKNHVTIIGKLCDVIVPEDQFRDALLQTRKYQPT